MLTAADIPGKNDIAPVFADEPLFAEKEIMFHGQALFAVVAETATRRAARRGSPRSTSTGRTGRHGRRRAGSGARVLADYSFGRGDAAAAIDRRRIGSRASSAIGGQEHFYLEGPGVLRHSRRRRRDDGHASTQDPTETQHIVARILGVPDAFVTVETRRMGGEFGGKESQACAWAAIAALAARVTGKPCKVRLDRDDDFALTGKRHDFRADGGSATTTRAWSRVTK